MYENYSMIARIGGLMPASVADQYEVDNLISAADDIRSNAYGLIFGEKTPATVTAYKAETIDKHMANLERILGDKQWFAGSSCTIADCTVFDVCNNYTFNLLPGTIDAYPKLKAFMARFAARPKIQAYMATDQFTKLRGFSLPAELQNAYK